MIEDYKSQIKQLIDSLPYKIGDKVYQFKDDEIKEYKIVKIELSSAMYKQVTIYTDLNIYMHVYDGKEKITTKYTLDGVMMTFSPTPLLAIDKIKSKYLDKINDIQQIYNNYIQNK